MIFVTVGTQLPFDRLVLAVDAWAKRVQREDVLAQVGMDARLPSFIESRPTMPPGDFRQCIEDAALVIGHAGMGTIISALELGKPLIIMPRRAHLGEHRNDHQLATVKRLSVLSNVQVAHEADELANLLTAGRFNPPETAVGDQASPELLRTIRHFVSPRTAPRWQAQHTRQGR
jgi:UDP-N-acetylglucosamine transferase subunit ALG13